MNSARLDAVHNLHIIIISATKERCKCLLTNIWIRDLWLDLIANAVGQRELVFSFLTWPERLLIVISN